MENLISMITKLLSENAPTVYTIVGLISSGSFIGMIWKGIPKIAQVIGLKDSTVKTIETIVDNNQSSINVLIGAYSKKVQDLIGTFNTKMQLMETKNALFFELLYTVAMNSNVQNGVKSQITDILKNYEKLTTTTLASIEKELEEKLKEDIQLIPEQIQKEQEALNKEEEKISAVEEINIVDTLIK